MQSIFIQSIKNFLKETSYEKSCNPWSLRLLTQKETSIQVRGNLGVPHANVRDYLKVPALLRQIANIPKWSEAGSGNP